jgi:hypothetical protein
VRVEGEARLWLRDPLELAGRGQAVLVPEPLVPLLAGWDGTHDAAELGRRFEARTGMALPPGTVERLVDALDGALLLDSPRFREALDRAGRAYRQQPFRQPTIAGRGYPADGAALDARFREYAPAWTAGAAEGVIDRAGAGALGGGVRPPELAPMAPLATERPVGGVLSPHIDYQRGGPLYAATWEAAVPALAGAEVVVVFGTDHHGGGGKLTPTRLPYATPWGPLPLDVAAVDALGAALGGAAAFEEELHHKAEHSIELAGVWLHWALRRAGRDGASLPPLLPVLCGSFAPYTQGAAPGAAPCPLPEDEPALDGVVEALAVAVGGRRALVVSAADLAHVGPAFGDAAALDDAAKVALAASDARLLEPALAGSAGDFLGALREVSDRTRVCGLPPTYWALRLLARLAGRPVPGRLAGYRQCPADDVFGSVVSIAGVLWDLP